MAKKATSTKQPAKAKSTPAADANPSGRTRPRTAAQPGASRAGAKSAGKSTGSPQARTPAKPAAPATITLKHLATGIVERHGLAKKQADTVLAEVFAQLVDHLKAGERVRIGGFGIIQVKDRPARMGRNPATGEAIQIQASRKIAFRPAKELKEAI